MESEKDVMEGSEARKREGGFTLVEILTVALIIVILATFAFPSYRKSRQRALETQGLHGMKGFAAAQEHYFSRNGRYAFSFGELQANGIIDSGYTMSDGYKGVGNPFIKGFTVFWETWPSGMRYSIRARTMYNYNILSNDFVELRVTDGGNVKIRRYAEAGGKWRTP